jgi:AraC-like DNA-binding protein
VKILWNRFGKRMRLHETYNGSTLIFGCLLEKSPIVRYRGQEFSFGQTILWQHGIEHDYVVPVHCRSLEIQVDAALAEVMGWTLHRAPVQQVSRRVLRALIAECRRVTALAAAAILPNEPPDDLLLRDRILARLDAALAPWREGAADAHMTHVSASRYFSIVRGAESLFEQADLHRAPAVDVLARELGVSPRTLYYAFRQSLGMTPYAYLQLVRLHRLRDCLLAGKVSASSVTTAAMSLGFNHLGRLSGLYRTHFGESPRETLKRQSQRIVTMPFAS